MRRETVGVVVNGRIQLPPGLELPEGATVHVYWEEAGPVELSDNEGSGASGAAAGIARALVEPADPFG